MKNKNFFRVKNLFRSNTKIFILYISFFNLFINIISRVNFYFIFYIYNHLLFFFLFFTFDFFFSFYVKKILIKNKTSYFLVPFKNFLLYTSWCSFFIL